MRTNIRFAIGDIGGTFPTNSYSARISDARGIWNARNRELYFAWVSSGQRAHVGWYSMSWPNSDKWAVALHYGCAPTLWGAEIHVNQRPVDGKYTWYTGIGTPGGTQGDLYSVMIHEWGHLVELFHTGPGDIMNPSIGPGVLRRDLSKHDIESFQLMYPPK